MLALVRAHCTLFPCVNAVQVGVKGRRARDAGDEAPTDLKRARAEVPPEKDTRPISASKVTLGRLPCIFSTPPHLLCSRHFFPNGG